MRLKGKYKELIYQGICCRSLWMGIDLFSLISCWPIHNCEATNPWSGSCNQRLTTVKSQSDRMNAPLVNFQDKFLSFFYFLLGQDWTESTISWSQHVSPGQEKGKKDGRCVRRSAAAVAVDEVQSLRDPHKPSVGTPSTILWALRAFLHFPGRSKG